jgi:hypothetical protein
MPPLYLRKGSFLSKKSGPPQDIGASIVDDQPFQSGRARGASVRTWGMPTIRWLCIITRGREAATVRQNSSISYLQAEAYSVYDAFFKPARGLTEVVCMNAHAPLLL